MRARGLPGVRTMPTLWLKCFRVARLFVRIHLKERIMAPDLLLMRFWPLFGTLLMEIKVNFLDKLRLEAKFDDFTVIADQPIRYKGDGSAPGPFDYFLASSALCAAYFVKLYCNTRDIPTENIRLSQNNIVDPENRYAQIFKIQVELPADISDKDRQGILRSIERCTVKKSCRKGRNLSLRKSKVSTPMHKLC
jgi:uncharacterized OsmC-like protein